METRVVGKLTRYSVLQFKNTLLPKVVSWVEEKSKVRRFSQFAKVEEPTVFRVPGKTTDANWVQFANADELIVSRVSGSTMDFSWTHPTKMEELKVVSVLGSAMDLS
jgi:cellobiose phosphorylase